MVCIIHYENINHQNKTVKLSQQTLKILQENKEIRNKLGGENAHIQQCNSIPDIFIDELVYYREQYQKFTYTKILLKRKSQENLATPRLSKRVRLTPESKANVTKKQLFPSCCCFYKKIVQL